MTFKEMREHERILETSQLAPGKYFNPEPFGAKAKGINFGSKYKFEVKEGPKVGQYDVDTAYKIIKPKGYEPYIAKSPERKLADNFVMTKLESAQDPGKYADCYQKPFGASAKPMVYVNSKTKFKVNDNPTFNMYEAYKADEIIKPRIKSAFIRENIVQQKRKPDRSPEPGSYEAKSCFGSEAKPNVYNCSKYVTKFNDNPPVGAYDVDKATEIVKSRPRSALIREDTNPRKEKRIEHSPPPGAYDGHLKPFGSDLK